MNSDPVGMQQLDKNDFAHFSFRFYHNNTINDFVIPKFLNQSKIKLY